MVLKKPQFYFPNSILSDGLIIKLVAVAKVYSNMYTYKYDYNHIVKYTIVIFYQTIIKLHFNQKNILNNYCLILHLS